MTYLKFKDSSIKYTDYELSFIDSHTLMLTNLPQNLSGFTLYTETDMPFGVYEDYIYDYKEPNLGTNVYKYTNDNHVYTAPVVVELTDTEKAQIEKQSKISTLQSQISSLQLELSSTDYIITKLYEYSLSNTVTTEYDINTLHTTRQALRDQIETLRAQLKTLTTK